MGAPVPGNIPWWMIRVWAQHYDLSQSQFAMLDLCIRTMDETYRAWIREKMEQERRTLEAQRRA